MDNYDDGDYYDYHNDYNNDANGFHLCQLIFFSIKLELAICNPVCHPDHFDHLITLLIIISNPPPIHHFSFLTILIKKIINPKKSNWPEINLPTTAPK